MGRHEDTGYRVGWSPPNNRREGKTLRASTPHSLARAGVAEDFAPLPSIATRLCTDLLDILYHYGNISSSSSMKVLNNLLFTALPFILFNPWLCFAQSGSLDTTFNPFDQGYQFGDWFHGSVTSIAVLPDDRILVTGSFITTNGISTNRVARLFPDGSLDGTFNVGNGPNNNPSIILPLNNGNIMVGGCFDSFNGIIHGHIACLDANGAYLPSLNMGSGAQSWVSTIVVQSDGKLIIGGQLSNVNGTAVHGIARLHPDGTVDPTFDVGTGTNAAVMKVVLQDDGRIILIGNFQQFGGVLANQVVRLNSDGTIDPSFNIGNGPNLNLPIRDIVLQNDGRVVLVGEFASFNGFSCNGIVRLNQDGSVDTTFAPDLGVEYKPVLLKIRNDGKFIIAKATILSNQTTLFKMALVGENGELDAQFNSDFQMSGGVNSIAFQSDGKILVGGSNFGGLTNNIYGSQRSLIRLNADGSHDSSFHSGTGCNGVVNSVLPMPDGGYVLSGYFTSYSGSFVNNVVRVGPTGVKDDQFVSGTWTNGLVSSSAWTAQGKLLVGGLFNNQSAAHRTGVVQMLSNGSLDPVFSATVDTQDEPVSDIKVLADGKILIVGEFDTVNGIPMSHIARLNGDGTLDGSFSTGIGVNGDIHACAIQTDGKIILCGAFYTNNGITAGRVVRIYPDGSADNTFNTLFGANSEINSVAIQPDGKVILAGDFTMYGGIIYNRIVRLNTDATIDQTFDPGTGANNNINKVIVQPDGKIVLVGGFTMFNGVAKNMICRLLPDGSIDENFNEGSGSDFPINTISLDQNGALMIGGYFTSYDGIGRNRVARINNDLNLSIEDEHQAYDAAVLFPNPAIDKFLISHLNGSVDVALIDINGRTLFAVNPYLGQTIDVSHVAPGAYWVRVVSDYAVSNFKLIVQ
jgi:uncharacterized delta-60 repeat protein